MNVGNIHKMKPDSGFTLIEIIITIVVGAILSVFVVQVMSSIINKSPESLNVIKDEATAISLMETIISDYVEEMNTDYTLALGSIETAYSSYSEVAMQYTDLTGGSEPNPKPGSSDTLKVIVDVNGYILTALLTNIRKTADDPKIRY